MVQVQKIELNRYSPIKDDRCLRSIMAIGRYSRIYLYCVLILLFFIGLNEKLSLNFKDLWHAKTSTFGMYTYHACGRKYVYICITVVYYHEKDFSVRQNSTFSASFPVHKKRRHLTRKDSNIIVYIMGHMIWYSYYMVVVVLGFPCLYLQIHSWSRDDRQPKERLVQSGMAPSSRENASGLMAVCTQVYVPVSRARVEKPTNITMMIIHSPLHGQPPLALTTPNVVYMQVFGYMKPPQPRPQPIP